MNESVLLELTRRSLIVALEISLPLLFVTLIVGVFISLFQAVTQIQETTLSFVPKVLAFAVTLAVLGPWMLSVIVGFMAGLFNNAPGMIR